MSQGRLEKVKQKVLSFSFEGILCLFANVNVTYTSSSKEQYTESGSRAIFVTTKLRNPLCVHTCAHVHMHMSIQVAGVNASWQIGGS